MNNIRTSKIYERKTRKHKNILGFQQSYFLNILLLVILGSYYVWTLNLNATSGYELSSVMRNNNEILLEKDLLEVQKGKYESLDYLVSSQHVENMNSVKDYTYVVVRDSQYAFSPDHAYRP